MKHICGTPEDSCFPDDLSTKIIHETLHCFVLIANQVIKKGVNQIKEKLFQDLVTQFTTDAIDDLVKQIDDNFAKKCHDFWCLKEIGTLYDTLPETFPSHIQYFASYCKRIFAKNYIPSFEDYVMLPETCPGPLEEFQFLHAGYRVRLVTVHQQAAKKKWINLFDSATAVVFFADMTSCFRKQTPTSTKTIHDQNLALFGELVNCKSLEESTVMLFLTGKQFLPDILYRMKQDPATRIKHYGGGLDMDKYIEFLKEEFINQNKNQRRGLYIHILNLVNSRNIEVVWGACADISIYPNLDCSGLSLDGPSQSAVRTPSPSTIGFAVGGAKDVVSFRRKIISNRVPKLEDVAYEGIFYDYYFDTSGKTHSAESTKLFYPSYSSAICKNPLTQETECYLSVGCNSSMKQEDFTRKKLNLMIVLDMSGSMGFAFESETFGSTKMAVANQCMVSLLNHLDEGDSFGMIAFDTEVEEICPQRIFDKSQDLSSLKENILAIKPRGGTDMHLAMTTGHKLLTKFLHTKTEYRNRELYENRMIFLTDAMPTVGQGPLGIADFGLKMTKDSIPIHTTYIGVGIDFDTSVVTAISKIPGSNYFTVQSSSEFKKRLDKDFDYMVTPLVFDLKLSIQSNCFVIDKVIGSPEAATATGELMKVNTLFPSKRTEQGAKGGVILVGLKPKIGADELHTDGKISNSITLTSSYKDRSGKVETETQVVDFENLFSIFSPEPQYYYDNTGIHKAIVLAHYSELLQSWVANNRFHLLPSEKESFEKMIEYLTTHSEEVEDDTLLREVQMLDMILSAKPPSGTSTVQVRKFWCLCSECDSKV